MARGRSSRRGGGGFRETFGMSASDEARRAKFKAKHQQRTRGPSVGDDASQKIYEEKILPQDIAAVEEQMEAMTRAVGTEEAAASARARDISRTFQGSAPGGFEDVLRGSITQEAGEALGYESALRGSQAQKELQDPSRMAPIVAKRQESLMEMEEEIAQQVNVGNAISSVSATAGGVMLAGATLAATAAQTAATAAQTAALAGATGATAAATGVTGATTAAVGGTVAGSSAAAGPAAPIVAVIGAVIAVIGGIIGMGVSGSASGRRGRGQGSAKKYDPSKVRQVSFQTALGSSQKGPRGYVGNQFTGGSALGAGIGSRIQNLGGMAPGAGIEPWMQFAGVE